MDNATQIIDELILRNYIYNRQRTPDITPDQWVKIYGIDVHLMELEYQKRCQN